MCGRTAMYLIPDQLKTVCKSVMECNALEYKNPNYIPSYNVCPTNNQPILLADQIIDMKWGLQIKNGPLVINARDLSKQFFQNTKRCIVLANAYYEWNESQPYCIKSTKDLFFMAGLYKKFKNDYHYCIVTTENIKELEFVHHRMPVLLNHDGIAEWLDESKSLSDVIHLIKPSSDGLTWYPVTKQVGKAGKDCPTFLEPIKLQKQSKLDFTRKRTIEDNILPSNNCKLLKKDHIELIDVDVNETTIDNSMDNFKDMITLRNDVPTDKQVIIIPECLSGDIKSDPEPDLIIPETKNKNHILNMAKTDSHDDLLVPKPEPKGISLVTLPNYLTQSTKAEIDKMEIIATKNSLAESYLIESDDDIKVIQTSRIAKPIHTPVMTQSNKNNKTNSKRIGLKQSKIESFFRKV
ncbi:hypothetical protein BC833DRAFT_596423 [Globomyces pollinis-pini]|nr:hypothetical protein BC833DRAFT_596423 [Globomyces pollinis-pini]